MDRFYWYKGNDLGNERNMIVQKNVCIYDGDEKAPTYIYETHFANIFPLLKTSFECGELSLTNLKLIWKDENQENRILSLELSLVTKVENESSGLFKSAKIVIHLKKAPKEKPSGPKQSSVHNFVKLSFRAGGNAEFYRALRNVLSLKDWEKISAVIDEKVENKQPRVSHRHVGIGGIEKKMQEKYEKTDKTVTQAFKDLDVLIDKAKEMVAIADKFSRKLQEKQISITDDETVAFKSYLLSMGIENPVTRDTHGSGLKYHAELAKQLAEFLQDIIENEGGVMTLSDVFCRFNRARGMELVSPEDLVNAAKLFQSLHIKMKFDSGVLIIQSLNHTEEEIITTTLEKVEQHGSLTSEELAQYLATALTLAKERLLLAEKRGKLCRDDTVEGLRFYPNRFLTEEN